MCLNQNDSGTIFHISLTRLNITYISPYQLCISSAMNRLDGIYAGSKQSKTVQ